MAYITKFSLEITINGVLATKSEIENLITFAETIFPQPATIVQVLKGAEKNSTVEAKWYNYMEQMERLAHNFPDFRFELEGVGEEVDDWWVTVFKERCSFTRRAKVISPYEIPALF